jgi:hypothetical protein
MNKLIASTMFSLAIVAMSPAVLAQNNASSNAPGQDRVCLVTTGNPGSFNDADVTETKWLPRKAADAQASKSPDTMKVFDYTNDPLVSGGQYASAEELCNNHFNK